MRMVLHLLHSLLAAVSVRAVYEMGIVGHAVNGTQKYAEESVKENKMLGNTVNYLEDALAKLDDIQSGVETEERYGEITENGETYFIGKKNSDMRAEIKYNIANNVHLVGKRYSDVL